jgi:hypothetical protein
MPITIWDGNLVREAMEEMELGDFAHRLDEGITKKQAKAWQQGGSRTGPGRATA